LLHGNAAGLRQLTMQRCQARVLLPAVGVRDEDQVKLGWCCKIELEDSQVGLWLADVGEPQLDA
jgi:hypothetical protein